MDAEGCFIIEGVGVKPDVDVDNLPRATFLGGDAQLETAIDLLKKSMAAKPMVQPKPGNYPRPITIK